MSRTIADVARYRSNEGLVGRAVELDALLGLLASEHLYVAYVHGVAGIGKSSLLAAFAARARRAGTMVVALDSRALEPTDRGFCAALGRALGVRSGSPKRLVERLGELGPRTVLVLDHYEVLRLIDTWLRQEFVPSLPDTMRVVIAGREPPVAGWLIAPELDGAVEVMPLGPLEQADALELLRRLGVEGSPADALAKLARGHPLALRLAAAAAGERPDLAAEDVAAPRLIEELTRLYLSDVDDPITRRALEAAGVVRRMTASLLAALLPDVAPQEAFERLRAVPFVEVRQDGLVVHEAVQGAMASFLRASDPVRHRDLRRVAWRALRDEVRAAGPEQLWRYTADMLYLIENPVVREAFFPSGAQPLAVEPARASDLAGIEVISRRHDGEAGWQVMRAWWEQQPTAFSVVRDRDGTVRGFHCLLEQRHLMSPRVADPVVEGWGRHLKQNPAPSGQVVLGYRRWLDIDHGESPCAAQAASWLDVKRTYMLLRPRLRRMYTVVQDPEPFLPVILKLGFRPFGDDGSAELGGLGYTSVGLDFGPGSVDGWLAGLVADELGLAPSIVIDETAREVRLDGSSVELTPLEFGVLKALHDHKGHTVTRATLLEDVWGYRSEVGSNVVDAVVRRLRDKLAHSSLELETIRGSGYRLFAG